MRQYIGISLSLAMAGLFVSSAQADEQSLLLTPHPMVQTEKGPWKLPANGPMALSASIKHIGQEKSEPQTHLLNGAISASNVVDEMGARVDDMLDIALARDGRLAKLDKAVAHFRSTPQQAVSKTSDFTNYIIPYRGFGPSKEAADVILEEKIVVKSEASAAYARQRLIDETHPLLVKAMMQIAMGIGSKDAQARKQLVAKGVADLRDLVGDDQAKRTVTMIEHWRADIDVPEDSFREPNWDVDAHDEKMSSIMRSALSEDPVVKEITRKLHKYNHVSKVSQYSAKGIQSTLGLISTFAPGLWIGPAAEAANAGFMVSTGGTEQTKLLKSLYYDKRIESRWRAIDREAQLAVNNYQLAISQKNPTLLVCSEAVVAELAGESEAHKILGAPLLTARRVHVPVFVPANLSPEGGNSSGVPDLAGASATDAM